MDFKNIQTFIKVAELKSFSSAASELGYSQSAVSTQISNLEKELGHLLFDRIGHKIALTANGIIFLQYTQNIQLLTEDLNSQLNGGTDDIAGTIRIAMADSICTSIFPNILIDFQKHYSKVKIVIQTGVTSELFTLLTQNEVDMICTLDFKKQRPDFVILKESAVNTNFYISSNHPLAGKVNVNISDIKQYPIYLTEENISYRKNLDDIIAEHNEFIIPTYEIGNVQVIKELILNSFGIGFIPEFVVKKELTQKSILPISNPNFPISIWRQLICHKGKALTPAMNALINFIDI
ncbi:LysR family transcriptional regulator [Lachnoclostridium sp.]|uniref:LysR family transcriptional regulator n=1 Tax=Lachnoclostridium sp. TaxID=2028282 RepID=UPI00289E5941|nr:LysR family transcriptional regulator [Lachnoclostridium sp.]